MILAGVQHSNKVMSPSLKQAVEDIYLAFGDNPRPTSIDGCPCCIDKKGISVLLSKPLRELSPNELSHYAQSVFLTVGTVEDFLYFLPRILEILTIDHNWWPSPEVVGRSIYDAEFHSWSDKQKQPICRFFQEVIVDLLSENNSGFDIDSWICGLGRTGINLSPYLNLIAANPSRLVEFYEVNREELSDGRLANNFWDYAPEEMKKVVEWFQSPETNRLISASKA